MGKATSYCVGGISIAEGRSKKKKKNLPCELINFLFFFLTIEKTTKINKMSDIW